MPSSQQERSSSSNFHWVSQSVGLQEVVSLHIHHMCFFMLTHTVLPFFPVFVPKLYSQIFTGIPPPSPVLRLRPLLNAELTYGLDLVLRRTARRARSTLRHWDGWFFLPGKVVMERMKPKKKCGLDFLGCFLLFFVWFLCWKVFLWGDFCWGESWGKLDGGFKSVFLCSHLFGLLFFPMGWKYIKKVLVGTAASFFFSL